MKSTSSDKASIAAGVSKADSRLATADIEGSSSFPLLSSEGGMGWSSSTIGTLLELLAEGKELLNDVILLMLNPYC